MPAFENPLTLHTTAADTHTFVTVEFKPQPDITAYELARLLPLFFIRGPLMRSSLTTDPAVLRHLLIREGK